MILMLAMFRRRWINNHPFTVTGDDNVIESNVDGKSVALTVVLDNSASLATGGATSGTLSAMQVVLLMLILMVTVIVLDIQ